MKPLVLSEPSRPARSASDPDPEVPAKARRRTFTAKYKLATLEEVEACTKPGEIGTLLRFEEITHCLPDVQDALVSILSERNVAGGAGGSKKD